MPTRIIRQPEHVDALADLLKGLKLPVTVSWEVGEPRRKAQNRLAQRWFTDISRHFGDRTHEEVRGECKMRFGVPVLREESEAFRMSYDRTLKHLPYEDKLAAIIAFDLPVTRLMTVKQMGAFMDSVEREYRAQGVYLTDPEALRWEQEFSV